jgi:hypothetical protein
VTWAESLGPFESFGIEGTGSYDAGLPSAVRRAGHRVVEVNREDRRARRANGKSDSIDAETGGAFGARRAVERHPEDRRRSRRDDPSGQDRQRHRCQGTNGRDDHRDLVKTIIVNAPAELRESLAGLTDKAMIDRCAGLRPGAIESTTASAKHTLRSLARRWLFLNDEIRDHDTILRELTEQTSPTLLDGFGIGADTAAEMLIIVGDNPRTDPLRSSLREALRRLPDPGRLGRDPTARTASTAAGTDKRTPRLPIHHRAHALPPAHHRLRRPAHPRRHAQTRDHPLRQALPPTRDLPARHDDHGARQSLETAA